jgi:CRISPR-associated protein Cmr6
MKSIEKGNRYPTPTAMEEAWSELIQSELKTGSKLGTVFEKAEFGGFINKTLTLYFNDGEVMKTAKGQAEPLRKKLPRSLQPCDRINFQVGQAPEATTGNTTSAAMSKTTPGLHTTGNPLQTLIYTQLKVDDRGNELTQPVLAAAVKSEKTCALIYSTLENRTRTLTGNEGLTFSVSFAWRLRVGGTRGFRELLLPVFHPVFGIPYIPASSLKGAARAWARLRGVSDEEINKILGVLDGTKAQAAKVEFLDAFPIKACLSLDVATPQWHWQENNQVAYKPEPHLLLSMEQPKLFIGLRPTRTEGLRPTRTENAKYLSLVKDWLENALRAGIGSRVSSGYGRALGHTPLLPHSYNFELWTQGMYGSEPPSKQNGWKGSPEFRPTAFRGVLRYWFRAFALSLYDPATCQELEEQIFGKLGQQGKASISLINNSSTRSDPHCYNSTIYFEAAEQRYLELLKQLLVLASHLGGVGRGSRRPLHLLNGRMRGCHWSVDGQTLPLEYDREQWQQLFDNLRVAFQTIHSPLGIYTSSPGAPGKGKRQQDVLDTNAQIWLVKSPNQLSPSEVENWQEEGHESKVRGIALELLYSDTRFKGLNRENQGNRFVGGALETPSFVWIKSIFPIKSNPYQVVTIFGVNQNDRLAFAKELEKLTRKNPPEAMLVFGQMPNENIPRPRPQHPIRRN